MKLDNLIPASWRAALADALADPKVAKLESFLTQEMAQSIVYPPQAHWFSALESLRPDQVKVVIVGQDPYHGAGEAHGLAFSVPHGIKTPPSLRNIWQELARDFGITPPQHGNLAGWASQGVLLLNTALTVRADCAGSHSKQGWDLITNAVIAHLANTQRNLVFLLWGAHAQKRGVLIDSTSHCILTSAHPSPLSVYRGFSGCGHFSATNTYLEQYGKAPIDWAAA